MFVLRSMSKHPEILAGVSVKSCRPGSFPSFSFLSVFFFPGPKAVPGKQLGAIQPPSKRMTRPCARVLFLLDLFFFFPSFLPFFFPFPFFFFFPFMDNVMDSVLRRHIAVALSTRPQRRLSVLSFSLCSPLPSFFLSLQKVVEGVASATVANVGRCIGVRVLFFPLLFPLFPPFFFFLFR